jgi:tRNA threonylcarbamoyladenosine modification (KEOPS) complex  Pcc1 subunit
MATSTKATLRLKLASKKHLSTILNALTPETKAQVTRRAYVKLEKKSSLLLLTVEAKDTVALRATLNAYLRWISCTIKVIEVVG